jgi:muconate cycloisomerase
LKVAELTVFQVRIPLRKPIRHASHARNASDNVIVRCVLDNGTQGFGEGVPRDYVTGETIDTAISILKDTDLASQLEPCRDFERVIDQVEQLRLKPVPADDRQCQGNAARCAVELALLDAFGRHFGKSLSAVAALVAGDLYQPRPRVRYSGAITSANGFKLRLAAWAMCLFRFRQVKVKVGIAGQNDRERLRLVRRRLGKRADIRVDANEAWTPDDAVARIRELQAFDISAVEQPIAHEDVKRLAEVRRQVQVPIMLDESLCSRTDAERAVGDQTCDLFNLRLSKCGGFIPSLRLAQFARQHGLGYQLGCQVGETALLSAAGRHFAATVRDLRYVEGSYDRHLVREALATEDLTFRWGGWAAALDGPGLGVCVDPVALERVTVRKEPLLG